MTLSFFLVPIESRACFNIYHGKLHGMLWKSWEIALVRDSFMLFHPVWRIRLDRRHSVHFSNFSYICTFFPRRPFYPPNLQTNIWKTRKTNWARSNQATSFKLETSQEVLLILKCSSEEFSVIFKLFCSILLKFECIWVKSL